MNEYYEFTDNGVHYQDYRLNSYKERTPYDSNCIEFWATISDQSIPNIIPNRYWISTFGRIWNMNRNKFSSYSMHMKGYYQIALQTKDPKIRITRKIHRILMTTFCYFPGCEQYEVNHIDGCKTNNMITNLEWCTHSENTIHAINMGLKKVFGHDYKVLLNNKQIIQFYILKENGYSLEQILEMMDIDPNVSIELLRNMMLGLSRKPDSMIEY